MFECILFNFILFGCLFLFRHLFFKKDFKHNFSRNGSWCDLFEALCCLFPFSFVTRALNFQTA